MVILYRQLFKKLLVERIVLIDVLIFARLNIQTLRMYRFPAAAFLPFAVKRMKRLYLLFRHTCRKIQLAKSCLLLLKERTFFAIVPFHVWILRFDFSLKNAIGRIRPINMKNARPRSDQTAIGRKKARKTTPHKN